jgi:hypothetical protein
MGRLESELSMAKSKQQQSPSSIAISSNTGLLERSQNLPILVHGAQFSEDMLWSCINPDFVEVRCRNGNEFIEG